MPVGSLDQLDRRRVVRGADEVEVGRLQESDVLAGVPRCIGPAREGVDLVPARPGQLDGHAVQQDLAAADLDGAESDAPHDALHDLPADFHLQYRLVQLGRLGGPVPRAAHGQADPPRRLARLEPLRGRGGGGHLAGLPGVEQREPQTRVGSGLRREFSRPTVSSRRPSRYCPSSVAWSPQAPDVDVGQRKQPDRAVDAAEAVEGVIAGEGEQLGGRVDLHLQVDAVLLAGLHQRA